MFSRIMVPVDLAHQSDMERALDCAADLARLYGAGITYVGVTATTPGASGHNPEEFGAKLAAFAKAHAGESGVETHSHVAISHDPAVELDEALMQAVNDTGTDLVVMASHLPNLTDYIWPSNGGKIAAHAKCSVMVVRG